MWLTLLLGVAKFLGFLFEPTNNIIFLIYQ